MGFAAEYAPSARSTPASRTARVLGLTVAVLALVSQGLASAQPSGREPLNSERIAAKFGSYGVQVLEQTDELRLSNLYSDAEGAKTCRTFALVRYPQRIDPRVASEHAAIVAGGSIGAVLAANGWQVRKTHLFYGEIAASPRLAELMHVSPGSRLAEHLYVLDVAKDDSVIEYAALVEIHHPDYLRVDELPAIYGPADAAPRRELVAELLAVAADRAR